MHRGFSHTRERTVFSCWREDVTGGGESSHSTPPPSGTDTSLLRVEPIAHIREPGNARITIMFHTFEDAPQILRMWGTGMYAFRCVHPFLFKTADVGKSPATRFRYYPRVWHTRVWCFHATREPQGWFSCSDRHRRAQGRFGEQPQRQYMHVASDPRSKRAQFCGLGILRYKLISQRSQLGRFCETLE